MKKIILLACLLIVSNFAFGQTLYKKTKNTGKNSDMYIAKIPFSPKAGKDGYEGTIEIIYAFRNCFGDISVDYSQLRGAEITAYYSDGKKYLSKEIPEKFIPEKFSLQNFFADVYRVNTRLGRVKFDDSHIGHGVAAGCYGNGLTTLHDPLGIKYQDYKDKWWPQLRLRNFEFHINYEHVLINHELAKYFKELEKERKYDNLVSKANMAEATGNLDDAIDYYEEANDLDHKKDEDFTREKIETLEEDKKEKIDQAAFNKKMNEAGRFESKGDYEKAKVAYREALSIKPNDSRAQSALKSISDRKASFDSNIRKAEEAESNGNLSDAKKYFEAAYKDKPQEQWLQLKINQIAEELRIERKEAWQKEKAEEARAKDQQDAEQFNSYVGTLTILSVLLFKDVGKDKPKNRFRKGGWNVKWKFGYEVSSLPVYSKNNSEIFDGVNTIRDQWVDDYSLTTLNINPGLEIWPIRSTVLDIGLMADGYFGMGYSSEFLWGYNLLGQANFGIHPFKFIGKLGYGVIAGSYSDNNFGGGVSILSESEAETSYISVGGGIRINFKGWNTNLALEPSAILIETNEGSGGGFSMAFIAPNRINVEFTYLSFPRVTNSGTIPGAFDNRSSRKGGFYSIKLIRTFDFFERKRRS